MQEMKRFFQRQIGNQNWLWIKERYLLPIACQVIQINLVFWGCRDKPQISTNSDLKEN